MYKKLIRSEDLMFEPHDLPMRSNHEFERTLEVGDGQEACVAAVRGVTKSWTWLSNWTEDLIYSMVTVTNKMVLYIWNCLREWTSSSGLTDWMGMSLSKLWESVTDREVWHVAVHGVAKSWTWLSNWTELKRVELTCILLKKQKLNMCGDGSVTS